MLSRLLPLVLLLSVPTGGVRAAPPRPSTFSIVAADPETGEVGVGVASRFFGVGSVVPWAQAGVGAVATQANANTSYGPHGLALMEGGLTPDEVARVLVRGDSVSARRQFGIVSAAGVSATYTGSECMNWAGGRSGPGYAVQGNILAGEAVVVAMEKAFIESKGKPLAERLYAAIVAGDAAGGDLRGRQSVAILVARKNGGYGGFTDRAVDIRVDDHADPIREMGRLLGMGLALDDWNRGWTAFTERRFGEALSWQERSAKRAADQPAILPEVLYDLAVIRLAAGDRAGARQALDRAVALNPKLKGQAAVDPDLKGLTAAK